MKTAKSQLAKYEYLTDLEALYWEWLPETRTATWEQMQAALLEYVEVGIKYKPEKQIINEREQGFVFIPEHQEWIDEYVSAKNKKIGSKKFAFIKSDDIFIEVAAQQVFEEKNAKDFNVKMFNNLEEAKNWLANN